MHVAYIVTSLIFVCRLWVEVGSDDPQVLTESMVTLQWGRPGILPCSFPSGDVSVIAWLKGNRLATAETLVGLDYRSGKIFGHGYDEGRFNLTDNQALIINQVELRDEGKYFCYLVTTVEYPVHNQTNVTVRATILTDQQMIGWKDRHVTLRCDLSGNPYAVIWKKQDMLIPQSTWTVIARSHGENVTRYDGRFVMNSKYALTIFDLVVSDEGRYSCDVEIEPGTFVHNITDVSVFAMPSPPVISIQMNPNLRTGASADDEPVYQLICEVSGFKPDLSVLWYTSGNLQWAPAESNLTRLRDGTFARRVIANVGADQGRDQNWTCATEGEMINRTSSTLLRLSVPPLNDNPSQKPCLQLASIIWLMNAAIICLLVLVFLLYVWKFKNVEVQAIFCFRRSPGLQRQQDSRTAMEPLDAGPETEQAARRLCPTLEVKALKLDPDGTCVTQEARDRGFVYILDNHDFPSLSGGVNTRASARDDVGCASRHFEEMGYKPIVHQNLSKDEVLDTIRVIVKRIVPKGDEHGSACFVFRSLGNQNGIFGADASDQDPCVVTLDDVNACLAQGGEALQGKPKLILSGCCPKEKFLSGPDVQDTVSTSLEKTSSIASNTDVCRKAVVVDVQDMFVAYSSDVRFIPHLCKVLWKCAQEDDLE